MDKKILVIGAAILDVLVRPAGPEVFLTGSYPVQDLEMNIGGDAANESMVLAGLGKPVELKTVLGKDMAGRMILETLRKKSVEVSDSCLRDDMVTGINVVLVQENGERSFLTNPRGSLRKLAIEDISMPFKDDIGILLLASIFVSPRLRVKELEIIFRTAKKQGILVCADMTKPKNGERTEDMENALRWLDYFFANKEEAFMLTGSDDPEMAARELIHAGVGHVIIKCGEKGCLVATGKNPIEIFHVPAVPVENCIDTTGAGDSFAAGFLAALSEGRNLRQCAEFAVECGARAVTRMGATSWLGTG